MKHGVLNQKLKIELSLRHSSKHTLDTKIYAAYI